jgi:hypothetical protein
MVKALMILIMAGNQELGTSSDIRWHNICTLFHENQLNGFKVEKEDNLMDSLVIS